MTLELLIVILIVAALVSGGGLKFGGVNPGAGLYGFLNIVVWFAGIGCGIAVLAWILRHFGVGVHL